VTASARQATGPCRGTACDDVERAIDGWRPELPAPSCQ
jgi:hypothetical protein